MAGLAAVGFMADVAAQAERPLKAKKASQARLFSWRGATGHPPALFTIGHMHEAAPVAARRRPLAWRRWLLALLPRGDAAPHRAPSRRTQPTSCSTRRCPLPARERPFPAACPRTAITLPDDWAKTNPGHDGMVWYRVAFRFAEATLPGRAARALRRSGLHQPAGDAQRPPDLQRRPDGRADHPQLRPAAADHPAAGPAQPARQRPRPARPRPSGRERGIDPPRRRPVGDAARAAIDARQGARGPHVLGAGVDPRHQPAFWSASAACCSRSAGCTSARSISRTSAGSASAGRSCRRRSGPRTFPGTTAPPSSS